MKLDGLDHELELVKASLSELETAVHSRPGRFEHWLPDFALRVFAIQVLQYSRSVQLLAEANENSWSFPTARIAFETATDLLYLATAQSDGEYDQLGAQAVVAAEIALSKTHGKMNRASPKRRGEPEKQPSPLKERIGLIADQWESHRQGTDRVVWTAYEKLTASWDRGVKHWTGLGRERIHDVLRTRTDQEFGHVLDSWYDILSSRSHPGLHSPAIEWKDGKLTFILDSDQDNAIPLATARVAVAMATTGLAQRVVVGEVPEK